MYIFECKAKIIISGMEKEITDEQMAYIAFQVERELNDVGYYETLDAGKIGIRVHVDINSLPFKEVNNV